MAGANFYNAIPDLLDANAKVEGEGWEEHLEGLSENLVEELRESVFVGTTKTGNCRIGHLEGLT